MLRHAAALAVAAALLAVCARCVRALQLAAAPAGCAASLTPLPYSRCSAAAGAAQAACSPTSPLPGRDGEGAEPALADAAAGSSSGSSNGSSSSCADGAAAAAAQTAQMAPPLRRGVLPTRRSSDLLLAADTAATQAVAGTRDAAAAASRFLLPLCAALAPGVLCLARLVSAREACLLQGALLAAALLASCVARLRPASSHVLALALQSAAADQAAAMEQLRQRLAAARNEADILRAGCDAVSTLFPGAAACAFGSFADSGAVSTLECNGASEVACQALEASLLAHACDDASSIARGCRQARDAVSGVVDSRDLGGVHACPDWAAASDAGLASAQALTKPLRAGHLLIGFLQLHFGADGRGRTAKWKKLSMLRELSETVRALLA